MELTRSRDLQQRLRQLAVVDEALAVYAHALAEGVDKYLVGRPSRTVFDRK